jgi:hypothetical protein
MLSTRVQTIVAAGFLLGASSALPAQAIRLTMGFGVDTASTPNPEILALYRSYLEQRQDSARPNPFWSRSEQDRWPVFDLLSGWIYQGFTDFTVVHLAPAAGFDSTYVIRTLIASVDDSTHAVRPLALYRVYVVREAARWVLANALPRLTRSWQREAIGRVVFVRPPRHAFVRPRAAASAAFVDSLARAFNLSPPPAIEYYFTGDLLETFAALGLDFFPLGSDTVGGRAIVADRLVVVGSSSNGEGYRHELAHVVLDPLLVERRTAGLVVEGLMTWTGGSAGLAFADLLPGLQVYLREHPDLGLEALLDNPPPRQGTLDVGYGGLAVLCAMVDEKGGPAAIRELVAAGRQPTEVLRVAARLLGVPRDSLDRVWRTRVLAWSSRPPR